MNDKNMATIRPFRGIRYDESLVGDLSTVICPPYDIISPQLQQELYHHNKYNFIRLELSRELPQDTLTSNKYMRSAATLEQWLKEGILKTDKAPALYLHDHHFNYQAHNYRRRGLIICVRLETWGKGEIHPHEGTLPEPKGDRESLLWACQINTSPILGLFQDHDQKVSALLSTQEKNQPVISLNNTTEDNHYVWAITDNEIINRICLALTGKQIYIADGHHRYESALSYQQKRHTCSQAISGEEAFNFALMTLTDFADPGLIILPPHRLVRGITKSTIDELTTKLNSFFEIEEYPISMPNIWPQNDDLLNGETDQIKL
ncbi:DUF1015 family protein, partial [Chloroflexota bacterium]